MVYRRTGPRRTESPRRSCPGRIVSEDVPGRASALWSPYVKFASFPSKKHHLNRNTHLQYPIIGCPFLFATPPPTLHGIYSWRLVCVTQQSVT